MSKKQKGSKNRKKAIVKLAKQHQLINNQKNDFQHKVSMKIISENQAVALEDLNVSGMIKNHCLAQAISDVGWSEFIRKEVRGILAHKENIRPVRTIHERKKIQHPLSMSKPDMAAPISFYCNSILHLTNESWASVRCFDLSLQEPVHYSKNQEPLLFRKGLPCKGSHKLFLQDHSLLVYQPLASDFQ